MRYRHWGEDVDPARTICVDGDADAVLQLSHWPGNRTPKRFAHDLSTGMCLKLAQAEDRAELLREIDTVTNTHWDTDGLCSVFAVLEPQAALAHAQTLLAAAIAGDISVFTTPEGVKIDLTLTALTKHPDSPVQTAILQQRFRDDRAVRQAQYDYGLKALPQLLENPDLHLAWIRDEYTRILADLRDLREEAAEVERLDALDLAIVRTDRPLHETAVNTAAGTDRILTIGRQGGGLLFELRLTTLSWFELVSRPYTPRPDWAPLLEKLRAQAASDGGQWKADDLRLPTPRLAFVDAEDEPAPCAAPPEAVHTLAVEFFSRHPLLPAGI